MPAPGDDGPGADPPPRADLLVLLALIVLALAFRLPGIDWALPDAGRFFSYHPDESVVVGYSAALNPWAGRLDPGFYNYGSLTLLLNAAVIHAGEALGLIGAGPLPGVPSAGALLAARLVTVLLGAGTCGFLYGTGRRLFGRGAGIAAAVLYAVAPLAVQHGHFATVDVPATFFVAGALFFAARRLTATETAAARPARDLLWAGLWAGLAAAAKYNAALVVVAGAAAWWLRRPADRRAAGLGALAGGLVVGFLVGCPGALLNPAALVRDVLFEARHVSEGHGLVFAATAPAWLHHVAVNLRWGLGMPLLLVCIAGVAYALVRRTPRFLIPLAFAVPYYLLIALAQVKFARYTLPLFPPLVLLAGALLADGWRQRRRPWLRGLVVVAGAVAAAYAALFSVALDRVMAGPDPRDEAAAFVRGRGFASVGFATGPWFYSPPLHPLLAAPNPGVARNAAARAENPRLIPAAVDRATPEGRIDRVPVTWDVGLLERTNPDAVALSELNELADALRARDGPALRYLSAVEARYPEMRIFARPVQVFGVRLTNPTGARPTADPTQPGVTLQDLPHDMLYTNPTTVVRYR